MKTVAAIAAGSLLALHAIPAAAQDASCALLAPGSSAVPSATCRGCHDGGSHPVEIDYAQARLRVRSLRPVADAVAAGALLPNGRVECVSCHDGTSTWKWHLAFPPGARPVRQTLDASLPDTRPLCDLCHAVGE